ncbi:hypothetical protein [Streptomyces sp. NPDC001250]|uniref:hypothetical protein n=1 Tax=Streptomyces sp. NPDC001250 TaxID=3154382 RepID=UPI0033342143
MDLFLDRRDALKLARGAPLILAAERTLGGTAQRLGRDTKGFDAGTTAALEDVTAFYTKSDAAKGGGLYRKAIVAQLAEGADRIRDGVPPSLKARVTGGLGDVPEWASYFDAAEHASARAVSARDLHGSGRSRRASVHFTDAPALRKPGWVSDVTQAWPEAAGAGCAHGRLDLRSENRCRGEWQCRGLPRRGLQRRSANVPGLMRWAF